MEQVKRYRWLYKRCVGNESVTVKTNKKPEKEKENIIKWQTNH